MAVAILNGYGAVDIPGGIVSEMQTHTWLPKWIPELIEYAQQCGWTRTVSKSRRNWGSYIYDSTFVKDDQEFTWHFAHYLELPPNIGINFDTPNPHHFGFQLGFGYTLYLRDHIDNRLISEQDWLVKLKARLAC